MKKFFIIVFTFHTLASSAQLGISIYPFNNMVGLSISKINAGHSIFTQRTIDLRCGFEFSSADEATLYTVEPELAGLFRIQNSGAVTFMSGIGTTAGFNNVKNGYWGGFIPLRINIIPFSINCLHINIETDLIYKKYSGYDTLIFRPMVGVVYYFTGKKHNGTDENNIQ